MDEICPICGDELSKHYSHKLNCGHIFHYECLFKAFKCGRNNDCPYCRSENNLLPIVNGIKSVHKKIHDTSDMNSYQNIPCKTIIKSGAKKGQECGAHCKIGYFTCKRHSK